MARKLDRKELYNSIDVMKFILAFFVVAIHTDPLRFMKGAFIYKLYWSIINIAVPIFFMSTGYLLTKGIDEKDLNFKLNKYLRKIVKLYIVWNIVYFPLAIYEYIIKKFSALHSIVDYLRGFFLVGQHYNSWILWYLLSTIYAIVYILICQKAKLSEKTMLMISSAIWFLSILFTLSASGNIELSGIEGQLMGILKRLFASGRIFTGLFYIPVGIELRKIRGCKKIEIIMAIVGVILASFGVESGYLFEVGRGMASIGVFLFVVQIDIPKSKIYVKLRNASSTIYFIHLWVWTILYRCIYGEKTYGVVPFILTAVFSLLIAIVVDIWNMRKEVQDSYIC